MTSTSTEFQLAIARFRELRGKWGHLPVRGRTPEIKRLFNAAQVEMFYLAQVICDSLDPAIQHALDETRREIVEQIELGIKVPTGARVVTKRIANGNFIWSEFQITPELAVDPSITGNAVLHPLLKKLRALLRAQVATVNGAIYGRA